jgi:pimeloyl-ACP methyl ester carboxylesterase
MTIGPSSSIVSRDGTRIAFERIGAGPALILVDGALCSRRFGPMPKLAPLLAQKFSVYIYDRRGRGESGDVKPYSPEREVEDLGALLKQAGGTAFVAGLSSGAALALRAAAAGLPIRKLAVYEPPFVAEAGAPPVNHEAELRRLVADGRRGDAVKYFMGPMVGAPPFVVVMMKLMPWVWRKLVAVAHTLPYDAAVMGDFTVPAALLAAVSAPTLALEGEKTDARLRRATQATARSTRNASLRTLKGQTHNVDPKVLAPSLSEFFET